MKIENENQGVISVCSLDDHMMIPSLFFSILSVLQERSMYDFPGVLDFCEELYAKSIRSPHLLGFMIDCFDEMLEEKDCDCDKAALLARATQVRDRGQGRGGG